MLVWGMIAADIVRTVIVDPTLESVANRIVVATGFS